MMRADIATKLHANLLVIAKVRTISTEIGCPVGLSSNGQLLTGARFRELLDAGLSMVNVSVNGVSGDVYGTHMKHLDRATVNRNIEEMLRIKPNAVSLQGVITQQNHHEIPELVRYWTDKGVKVFTFNQCSNKSGFLEPGGGRYTRSAPVSAADSRPLFTMMTAEDVGALDSTAYVART